MIRVSRKYFIQWWKQNHWWVCLFQQMSCWTGIAWCNTRGSFSAEKSERSLWKKIFSSSREILSGSKYTKNIFLNYKNRSTVYYLACAVHGQRISIQHILNLCGTWSENQYTPYIYNVYIRYTLDTPIMVTILRRFIPTSSPEFDS